MASDAKFENSDIRKKNLTNVNHVGDMTLKSRAELQLTRNKLKELESDIDTLERTISEKSTLIARQEGVNNGLEQEARDLVE
jgi:hypothetical protein